MTRTVCQFKLSQGSKSSASHSSMKSPRCSKAWVGDMERQGEIASDHRDRGELVLVPCDLVVRVEHGHAQVTVMLGEVACTRTIEREADEALSRESLSPLDLARHPVEGLAKGIKGEPLDEVSKRVIDKGSTRTEPW